MALPLMVRAMRLSIEAVDRRLEGAARRWARGAGGCSATITLPLSLPGVLAGAVLGFARSLGEFGATITFVSNVPGRRRRCRSPSMPRCNGPAATPLVWRLSAMSVALRSRRWWWPNCSVAPAPEGGEAEVSV